MALSRFTVSETTLVYERRAIAHLISSGRTKPLETDGQYNKDRKYFAKTIYIQKTGLLAEYTNNIICTVI